MAITTVTTSIRTKKAKAYNKGYRHGLNSGLWSALWIRLWLWLSAPLQAGCGDSRPVGSPPVHVGQLNVGFGFYF